MHLKLLMVYFVENNINMHKVFINKMQKLKLVNKFIYVVFSTAISYMI